MKIIKTIMAVMSLTCFLQMSAQPKLVAHRGCRDTEGQYENTVSSLRYAQEIGVDAVEFDVQLTADDKLIVYHGPKIPGYDKTVNQMTFDEARAVKLPGRFRMPTLGEYFKQAKKYPEITLIMELKKQSTKERETIMVEQAVAFVKEQGMCRQVEYTTFSKWMCQEIHRLDPSAKVIYLDKGVHVPDAAVAKEKGWNGISYDLNAWMNRPEVAAQAKELGIETTLWMANDYEVIDWAVRHGIDYVSTDFPDKARVWIDAVKKYRK